MAGRVVGHAALLVAVGLASVIAGLSVPAPSVDAQPISAPISSANGVRQSADAIPVPGDVKLHVGDTADFDGGALQVRLVQVEEDSRCPMNAVCIWAGRALVRLGATVDGVDRGEVTASLTPVPQKQRPSDLDAVVERYVFSLTDLQPYPIAGQSQPLDQRVATIHVRMGTDSPPVPGPPPGSDDQDGSTPKAP